MSHFAKIDSGYVIDVIRANQDFINSGVVGDPNTWIQTSIRTFGNNHPEGRPLRGNYAFIGSIYDADNDVFYAPQPYPSWTLNTTTWLWDAPIPYPKDGNILYFWDEENQSWNNPAE